MDSKPRRFKSDNMAPVALKAAPASGMIRVRQPRRRAMKIAFRPNASINITASPLAPAKPPRCPRLAIERMKTPASVK